MKEVVKENINLLQRNHLFTIPLTAFMREYCNKSRENLNDNDNDNYRTDADND